MIKDEYINPEMLDDNSLLMQYFRKHDADNNNQLDGLELLKALARMDCKTNCNFMSDNLTLASDDHAHDSSNDGSENINVFDVGEMIPYVDTILREDDKVNNNVANTEYSYTLQLNL